VQWPELSYLVCASQRSGTELLCRGLAATGVAGCPREYFLAEDPAKLPAPQTRRQSNDLNEAWVAAYLADSMSHQEH
jgi:trehalose 2-sulfotransferase